MMVALVRPQLSNIEFAIKQAIIPHESRIYVHANAIRTKLSRLKLAAHTRLRCKIIAKSI